MRPLFPYSIHSQPSQHEITIVVNTSLFNDLGVMVIEKNGGNLVNHHEKGHGSLQVIHYFNGNYLPPWSDT